MKSNRLYEIPYVGLKTGVHEFNFDIEDKFFSGELQPDFTGCQAHIRLIFDKKPGFFLLKFEITGQVTVHCDRCGEPFPMTLWDEFDQVVKFVDNPAEMALDEAPDVSYISRTESHLDVSGWIYEFILLSIPMQRIHPDKAEGGPGCDPVALEVLDRMSGKEKISANPIWKDLDKFR